MNQQQSAYSRGNRGNDFDGYRKLETQESFTKRSAYSIEPEEAREPEQARFEQTATEQTFAPDTPEETDSFSFSEESIFETSAHRSSGGQRSNKKQRADAEQVGTSARAKMLDPAVAWRGVLDELEVQLSAYDYQTWLRDTHVIAFEDWSFIIGTPNSYVCDYLANRLKNRIHWCLSDIMGHAVEVTYSVASVPLNGNEDVAQMPLYSRAETRLPVAHHGASATEAQNRIEQEHFSAVINEADALVDELFQAGEADLATTQETDPSPHNQRQTPRSALDARRSQLAGQTEQPQGNGQLTAHFTFNTFVIGNHNRMATAAAEAVADQPGLRFNPLFIYGGVGLGKTHLLHSIGNRARENGFQVLYCSSEKFTNELIHAIRNHSTQEFRDKYRQVDILLIDDIQFIGGKESTQEEFFHTFNELYANGSQIVLSSDRPPKALATLEERLRSRFEGGLQTDISQPDFETRVAILQSKALRMGLRVSHDVLMMVAEQVDSNVRELEGALNQLSLRLDLSDSRISHDEAAAVLKTLAPNRTPCAPADVVRLVAHHFGLSVEDLTGRGRTAPLAMARQVAMYLLREENALSLPAIGQLLGGRDHTTVRYGVQRITDSLHENNNIRQDIIALREKIYMPPQAAR